MNLGIVILNYKTKDITLNLVEECYKMNVFKYIVVVDNNSNDEIAKEIKRYSNIFLIENSDNLGYAKGNNDGFRFLAFETDCDYAFLANPDVEFNQDVIINIASFLNENQDFCVVSSKRSDSFYGDKALQFWNRPSFLECCLESFYIYRRLNYRHRRLKSFETVAKASGDYITVDVVPGAFFGVNLELFAKSGFMDEDTFLWYEENCLAAKLLSLDLKEALLVNVSYYHNHRSTYHGNSLFFQYNLSKEHYCKKYLHINSFQRAALSLLDFYSNMEQKILNIVGRHIRRR